MNHADSDRPIVYDFGCAFGTKSPTDEDELEQDLINVQHHVRLMAAASSIFESLPVSISGCRHEQSTGYSNNSSLRCHQ
jgi:hypothetical protein